MTYCQQCAHVHGETMRLPPYRWLCTKHARVNDGFGFVTPTTWDNAPPFLYCKDVNGGACPLFEPLKTGDTNGQR